MTISTKLWKGLGAGLVVVLLGFVVVRTWVVPALIVRAIQGADRRTRHDSGLVAQWSHGGGGGAHRS